ncbi:hypothetical protein GEMRC1_010354 [Eukaryota sp. GEM-RC1]
MSSFFRNTALAEQLTDIHKIDGNLVATCRHCPRTLRGRQSRILGHFLSEIKNVGCFPCQSPQSSLTMAIRYSIRPFGLNTISPPHSPSAVVLVPQTSDRTQPPLKQAQLDDFQTVGHGKINQNAMKLFARLNIPFKAIELLNFRTYFYQP